MATTYLPPSWFTRLVMNRLARIFGSPTILEVRGRRSGKTRSVPVNVLVHDGGRYLIAPRGETEWARNLRAAGGGSLRTNRGEERIVAIEVPQGERAPIIAEYRKRWDRHVSKQFEALPDPASHPVFRIEVPQGS